MSRENILLSIVLGVLLITGVIWFADNRTGFLDEIFKREIKAPEGIILFYGNGCLHCKNVDDFIAQNKIEDKVKFTRLEVFDNAGNQKILVGKAAVCGISNQDIGVPLLWDGSTCVVGDEAVIKFFRSKAI